MDSLPVVVGHINWSLKIENNIIGRAPFGHPNGLHTAQGHAGQKTETQSRTVVTKMHRSNRRKFG